MGNIVLLDDLTINKIAAGEVIERPASVVKELVENSIDAGATNITVEIKNGGITYIRIIDNGKGIRPDDMEIAFERHATSKIRQANDLEIVKSLGFRGEALASIAAISKVTMKSKTENDDGYSITIEGGKILEKTETACPQGTMITIENLFYNTPVRYKFLKKDFTELGYIEDIITRIALVNPNISIKLLNSGKTIIQTSGNGNIKNVIYNIYGKEVTENIIKVENNYEDLRITGVIGKPQIARSNRTNQLFFVNNRFVKDKTLSAAAEKAFKGMITIGKFGFLILNIEINPSKVDCNVHPAKVEVRFQDEGQIFKAIYHTIKDNLLNQDYLGHKDSVINEDTLRRKNTDKIESIYNSMRSDKTINYTQVKGLFNDQKMNNTFDSLKEENKNDIPNNYANNKDYNAINDEKSYSGEKKELEKIFEKVKENDEDITKEQETENSLNEFEQLIESLKSKGVEFIDESETIKNEENQKENNPKEQSNEEFFEQLRAKQNQKKDENFEEMYKITFGLNQDNNEKDFVTEKEIDYDLNKSKSLFDTIDELQGISYKFIGIVFSTYIIIEINKDLYIIDQHAAHERIMYEQIKDNYLNEENKESQLMLLPDVIDLTHKEKMIVQENVDLFEKAGFIIEEFGENTIKLLGVPNSCIDLDTKELFLETLDEINTVAKTAKQEIEEKFFATVACKAAVKAKMKLSVEEVESLIDDLLKLENPFTCPHGRPTAIKISKNDIEKKFFRR